jgi:hypothetical protein
MSNYYYSGQGSLYVGDRDETTGRPDGLVPIGNVPTLELSIEVTKAEHKESESGSRGIDHTTIQETKGSFSMVLESLSSENLALAFFGDSTTVTGAAVVDEIVPVTTKGVKYLLDHVNLNDAVSPVVENEVPTTLVEDTDYTIDYVNGTITLLEASAQGVPEDLSVSYTYLSHFKVSAFTKTRVEKYLRFEGINTVDGEAVIVDIFKAELDPAQNFGLINDDIAQLTVAGTILYDTLALAREGSAFFIERRTQAVS